MFRLCFRNINNTHIIVHKREREREKDVRVDSTGGCRERADRHRGLVVRIIYQPVYSKLVWASELVTFDRTLSLPHL